MAKSTVKVWREGTAGSPIFPEKYEIVKRAVLQRTDIKTNKNKYYNIELHTAGGEQRVFTHYGRTDDLDRDPSSGRKENRFFSDTAAAEKEYTRLFKQKTGKSKGYREVSLASVKIGSTLGMNESSGDVDSKTLEMMKEKSGPKKPKKKASFNLHTGVRNLTSFLYGEATGALTQTANVKITADGLETPLGILTVGQIEKGEAILKELFTLHKAKKAKQDDYLQLSSDFYQAIPHRIGRTKRDVQDAVIKTIPSFEEKEETLQLMRDMLTVDGEGAGTLVSDDVDQKYGALGCEISWVEPGTPEYKRISRFVVDSQVKHRRVRVKNIYAVKRAGEHEVFDDVGNVRMLLHGSRIKNWVGILSRGILMPKLVVASGGTRTDGGWLGNGIYFGDTACTSAYYTSAGRGGSRMMAIADVSLGKMKDYRRITYGLEAPPKGFNSCHGVRGSEFVDDEYVIYRPQQQALTYLVEFVL